LTAGVTTTRGRVRVETAAKRVRVFLGGIPVADSARTRLVWESPNYPTYYFPIEDVRADALVPTETTSQSPSRGEARHFTVRGGDAERVDAALQYPASPIEELQGLVRFDWSAMDAWFEEDEEVFTHVRSPYTRVDILASSRCVQVAIDGTVLAESVRPFVLFETGLVPRWYLSKTDVRLDLLVPTDNVTHCPYKGQAEYWSAIVGDQLVENVAWSYRTPLPESMKIAGRIAFYNERVDLTIDGVLHARS
jgi:uncharacterized protein (DUF427 family)